MPRSFEGDLDATGLRFGVIASRFNDEIVSGLLDGALECLTRHGARDEDIDLYRVPGAFEIPTLARKLCVATAILPATGDGEAADRIVGATPLAGIKLRPRYDAVIALGCLLRGDTPHFDFISAQVTNELSRVAVDTQSPVAFGVITCNTQEQAVERSSKGSGNKGWEAALAAIEMAKLWRLIERGAGSAERGEKR